MPPLVRGKRSGNPSGNRIPFEHAADASITVFVFAYGLKEITRLLLLHLLNMQSEEFAKLVRVGTLHSRLSIVRDLHEHKVQREK